MKIKLTSRSLTKTSPSDITSTLLHACSCPAATLLCDPPPSPPFHRLPPPIFSVASPSDQVRNLYFFDFYVISFRPDSPTDRISIRPGMIPAEILFVSSDTLRNRSARLVSLQSIGIVLLCGSLLLYFPLFLSLLISCSDVACSWLFFSGFWSMSEMLCRF